MRPGTRKEKMDAGWLAGKRGENSVVSRFSVFGTLPFGDKYEGSNRDFTGTVDTFFPLLSAPVGNAGSFGCKF